MERGVSGSVAPALTELRPLTPWTWHQLCSLLRQLEALAPMMDVIHSLHYQALKVPEIAALPEWEKFTHAVADVTYARLAAMGFIRRLLWGDVSPEVWTGMVENLRRWAKAQRAFATRFEALVAKPGVVDITSVRALRQVSWHAWTAHQTLLVAAQQTLGLAEPLGE